MDYRLELNRQKLNSNNIKTDYVLEVCIYIYIKFSYWIYLY